MYGRIVAVYPRLGKLGRRAKRTEHRRVNNRVSGEAHNSKTDPREHHHIANSERHHFNLKEWLRKHEADPAVKVAFKAVYHNSLLVSSC